MMIRRWLGSWLLVLGVLAGCEEEGDGAKVATPAAGSVAPAAVADAAVTPEIVDAGAVAAVGFKVGDLVSSKWDDGYWYPGKIGAVNADGTYRVNYSDGDVAKKQPAKKIRVRKPSTSTSSSSSGGCGGGRTKCGGRCVDLYNDAKNCFSCGRECPEACMGGSCVSNAYKYGD